MSLCFKKLNEKRNTASIASLPDTIVTSVRKNKGTSLTAWRGSYTAEAAIVIPLIAICFVTILYFFRILQVQEEVQQALFCAGRYGAVEAAAVDSDVVPVLTAKIRFHKTLKEKEEICGYIDRGISGISFLGSKVQDDYLILRAHYQIKFPFEWLGLGKTQILQVSRNRLWKGHKEGSEKDPYVYCTPTGRVYHRSLGCPALDLTIHSGSYSHIKAFRNKNGHKYYPCRACGGKEISKGAVFLTDYGEAYHTCLSCPKLKRTVIKIRLSEAGGRPPCKKCGRIQ